MKISRIVLVLLCVVAVGQLAYYYPQLPAQVASHFGVDGSADGWAPKRTLAIIHVVATVTVFLLGAVGPWLIRHTPDALINLPNKDYWLQPERREATVAWIGVAMDWMASTTMLFFLTVMQMVFVVNLDESQALPMPMTWIVLGGYVAVLLALAVRLSQKFRMIE